MSDKEERAHQARHLIEEGLFAERFTALEAEYIANWRAATTIEDRERLHCKLEVMDEIRLDLVSIMTTGDIAAAQKK